MVPIYKRGGPHNKQGIDYTFKAVSQDDLDSYLCNGWVGSFEELHIEDAVFEEVSEVGSDYETELRAKIKALGGKAGGRSSIATLEKQLKDLEDGNEG